MGERRLRRLHAKVIAQSGMHSDPTGTKVLGDTLRLYEEAMEESARLAATADTTSAAVGALRLLVEISTSRLSLLSGMGMMPRSFRAADELEQARRLVRGFVDRLERHGIPPEVIEEFIALLDETAPPPQGSTMPMQLTA